MHGRRLRGRWRSRIGTVSRPSSTTRPSGTCSATPCRAPEHAGDSGTHGAPVRRVFWRPVSLANDALPRHVVEILDVGGIGLERITAGLVDQAYATADTVGIAAAGPVVL